jgi:AhpD family alkylhydroperoxidase
VVGLRAVAFAVLALAALAALAVWLVARLERAWLFPGSQAALAPGALDTKTKELIALAISVAVRCDPCITYHASAAQRQGASREEVTEAMSLALYMGAGPAAMYAAQALEAFDQYADKAAGR